MSWEVLYLPEAENDLQKLDGSQRILVLKAIKKVRNNPLPQSEGGYGKPLGNNGGRNLTNLLKIKLKASGIRIVYSIIRQAEQMIIIVIGIREDEEVYNIAESRNNNET